MAVSEKEFVALVNENRGIIYKVIRLYIYQEEDIRDLYQEIVFQAWKSYPRFDGRSKFSTWLYRVGLNTVLTFKRRPVVVVPHEDLTSLNVAQTKTNTDESEALYTAIRQLPEVDRMIISLHLDGYENEEIAEITGLTKNNTAVKLHRIKDILIKKLKAE
ncbi:MAG: sigma-70 family RNA polymerase sigma factor [Cyclobacteriaceae bacterium]|nr:MAG: sigma-70 family RNA polymerase sigma factor [Cyclobacteriaceae bacterium]